MRVNPYDQVAYRTFPRRQTHPDRLAAIARLFGMQPALKLTNIQLRAGDLRELSPADGVFDYVLAHGILFLGARRGS